MATFNKLLLAISLSLLVSVAVQGQQRSPQLSDARQCRLQRLKASQPSQQIQSEGGVTELWDENEDQFRCAGVAPLRNTLQPNSLSLPNFHPAPRLVYIEKGQGLIGVHFPGCAETFSQGSQQEQGQQGGSQSQQSDRYQKAHRIRQGDIVALPAGAAHWCFNDGNEELVAVSVTDLNNPSNQLDQKLRLFYLAGSPPRQGQHSQQARETFHNIFNAFDEQLMAEAFNIPVEIVRKMQNEDERGLIVKVKGGTKVIRPDEGHQEEYGGDQDSNGLEETLCNVKIRTNIDNQRQVDIYSRQAGSLNIVNHHKLPILRSMDMGAERGRLSPNALFAPHWSMNSHSIVYVTRGEAQVQIVGPNGKNLLNDRVKERNMFVVPQFFAATVKAGSNGFEWVSFKTSSLAMDSPLAGYTSVMKAMPNQVITNAYQVSQSQAINLKSDRGGQSFLLSPGSGGRQSSP